MKRVSAILTALMLLAALIPAAGAFAASNGVNILINGKAVVFTQDSGYPYVDENFRTMVPLRAAMEAAGATVGYDPSKETAIVIMEHDRIEVPIGSDYLYNNNVKVQNDTVAVTKNGRTFLPIRAVLESAGYTVEWDESTKTVNAYNFDYTSDQLVPYSTGSYETLLRNILEGNVVYVGGQYYATPEYWKMANNVQMNYSGSDLNTAIYPQASRYDFSDLEIVNEFKEWVTAADLQTANITFKVFVRPGGYSLKGFYSLGYVSKTLHEMPSLPDDFLTSPRAGTFDGIELKVENGEILFNQYDLLENEVLKDPIVKMVYVAPEK